MLKLKRELRWALEGTPALFGLLSGEVRYVIYWGFTGCVTKHDSPWLPLHQYSSRIQMKFSDDNLENFFFNQPSWLKTAMFFEGPWNVKALVLWGGSGQSVSLDCTIQVRRLRTGRTPGNHLVVGLSFDTHAPTLYMPCAPAACIHTKHIGPSWTHMHACASQTWGACALGRGIAAMGEWEEEQTCWLVDRSVQKPKKKQIKNKVCLSEFPPRSSFVPWATCKTVFRGATEVSPPRCSWWGGEVGGRTRCPGWGDRRPLPVISCSRCVSSGWPACRRTGPGWCWPWWIWSTPLSPPALAPISCKPRGCPPPPVRRPPFCRLWSPGLCGWGCRARNSSEE